MPGLRTLEKQRPDNSRNSEMFQKVMYKSSKILPKVFRKKKEVGVVSK